MGLENRDIAIAGSELAGRACPYCRFPFKEGVRVASCERCGSVHHEDCWQDNGGCAVVGCTAPQERPPGGHSAERSRERLAPGSPGPTDPPPRHREGSRAGLTMATVLLALAVAGVGVAILVVHADERGAPTRRASAPSASGSSSKATSASPRSKPAREKTASRHVEPARRPDTDTTPLASGWPAGYAGYTVALASDVIRADATGAVARARADGLPRVGYLRSDRYSSLTPGYWFVFSGAFSSPEEARRYVPAAVAAGFADAYVREVRE